MYQLKAVWRDLGGCAFGKTVKRVGGDAPLFARPFPGPRGREDFKNGPQQIKPECLLIPSGPHLGAPGEDGGQDQNSKLSSVRGIQKRFACLIGFLEAWNTKAKQTQIFKK